MNSYQLHIKLYHHQHVSICYVIELCYTINMMSLSLFDDIIPWLKLKKKKKKVEKKLNKKTPKQVAIIWIGLTYSFKSITARFRVYY